MTYFYDTLRKDAIELIDLKKTADDAKAYNDIQEIYRVMGMDINNPMYVNEAIVLDERLRKEYPEIQRMCNIIDSMAPNGGNKMQCYERSIQKNVEDSLQTDMFGILTSVLLKHEIISDIKRFIEKVE